MATYLLKFDDEYTGFDNAADAQSYFGDWPEKYEVIRLNPDGTWVSETDDFLAEHRRRDRDASAYEADVRSTYYAGVL